MHDGDGGVVTVAAVTMTWPQFERCECRYKDYVTPLSAQEAAVLSTLLVRGPRPTSIAILAETLWRDDVDGGPENAGAGVAAVIRRLRAKLPGAIAGRRGFGWFVRRDPPATGRRQARPDPDRAPAIMVNASSWDGAPDRRRASLRP